MSKVSYGNGSSSNSWSSKYQNTVLCKHNVGAVLRFASKGENAGKWFYGCSFWPRNHCDFFKLADVKTDNEELEKKILTDKIQNLKMKNEQLKGVVVELNAEIRKHRKSERLMLYALLVSWVVFALCCMFKGL